MPSSRVRCVIRNATTAYVPENASTRPITPRTDAVVENAWNIHPIAPIIDSSVKNWNVASGSIALTAAVTAALTLAASRRPRTSIV